MQGKESTTRSQSQANVNLAPRNVSPWRRRSSSSSSSRSVSPSPSSTDTAAMYSQPLKRIPDSAESSISSSSTTGSEHRLARRPVFIPTGGKSVAALQQHHQWLMQQQQQQQQQQQPPICPRPSKSIPPLSTGLRSPSPATPKSHRRSPIQREEEEEEEIESIEENQDDHANARNHGPLTPTSSYSSNPLMSGSQEFKVAREGWIYRKNTLLQWKPVYAVAKHGNAIKPGGLYLYKDDKPKFSSHIHTYDMSEAVEVEPRSQEYRAGIKWEFRILVKREDVLLATDDIQSRKEWIDALTSIMGKVSIATHSELQTRTRTAEQYNRDLQAANEELETENQQLREQLAMIEEDFAKRERNLHSERTAREKALITEMENIRQTLETKCDILEHEVSSWRAKASDRKKQANNLEAEVHKWRARVEELETEKPVARQKELRFEDEQPRRGDDWQGIKDGLRTLRDQIKSTSDSNPLLQAHVLDIKSAVNKLHENLEEACSGWNELQADIVRFLDTERENKEAPAAIDKLRIDISSLREELLEIPEDDEEEQRDSKSKLNKSLSLSGKFDVIMKMMEILQATQNRLVEMQEANEEKGSCEDKDKTGIDKEDFELAVSTLREKLVAQKSELSQFMEEVKSQPEAVHKRLNEMTETIRSYLNDCKETGNGAHDEHEKSLKVVGQLFQHIISQIEASVIPDLPVLFQQLEDVVDRLNSVEERLISQIESPGRQDIAMDKGNGTDMDEIRELVVGTRGFMERTLRVLDRFGGSHAGMEETVRRAVKSAFNSHMDVNWKDIGKSKQDSVTATEEKLKQYEENARGYFDKSMSGMREHLEEYTGVLYKMIEDLVLRAVEHLEGANHKEEGEQYKNAFREQLERDIHQLGEERQRLQKLVNDLRQDTSTVQQELARKKADLQSVQVEYATTLKAGQEHSAALARDLEPLIRQIAKLRQLDLDTSDDSEGSAGYVDLGKVNVVRLVLNRSLIRNC
ncbi:hypothetical protein EC973_005207 [Apophysomyces ossiformis]|uniref:PH domain-containing protein n=1 Tax=Apophysomyces ossiformis TaxID=679940 RepID=A0A8H7BWJ5_9FUNG|nr:hypothetical protein EC973_005207 [Apophysomyces ossiformis]